MSTKYSVLMAQPNYAYGRNIFVPYSVGSLQAYALTFPEIRENFQFQHPLFLRTDPVTVIKNIEEPAVACFSCYLWNWEYNQALAGAIKTSWPNCLIIFGGTQVPHASTGFFTQHPYVDLLVHHEGELTFVAILREFLSNQPDYSQIIGISLRVEGDQTLKTAPAPRLKGGDLARLPSPYLAGIFDYLLKQGYILNASYESDRGCPYQCTFCDWGGVNYSQLYRFEEGRLLEEFEWFGQQRVEYLFNCDANYGILPRDYDLTVKMLAIRAKHGGYPLKFRMCTAKKSDEKIFQIAKMLHDAGMSKGATLSFQSMDETTLNIVKRKNIGLDVFHKLMGRYRQAGIPTYTELIMGMPGETYQSTKTGIDKLIDGQPLDVNIFAYVCGMLLNSEMSKPEYVAANGIKAVRMPILLAHSTPEPESLTEYQEVVVETSTMSNADWKRTYLFYWAIQAFHCLGLLPHVAVVFHQQFGLRYSEFYERLLEHFSLRPNTAVGEQIAQVRRLVDSAMTGGRLDLVLPEFGNIYWPLEEASFLQLVTKKTSFYEEIRSFLDLLAEAMSQTIDPKLLDDLVLYQKSVVKDPYTSAVSIDLDYDLHDYFGQSIDSAPQLISRPTKLNIKADHEFRDLEDFAQRGIWYARKGGRLHHANIAKESIVTEPVIAQTAP